MDLPEFPQGGEVARGFGTGGVPPEQFRGLQTPGAELITQTLRPEDTPAMQAALGAEVDTLLGGSGQPAPPASSVPGAPDTTSPQVPPGSIEDRIKKVLSKYDGNPEEIAKALVHSNKAMTETFQDRSMMAQAVNSMAGRMERLEQLLTENRAYTPADRSPSGSATSPTQPEAVDGDAFLRDPIGTLMPHIQKTVDETMRTNILAYSAAQREVEGKQAELARLEDTRARYVNQEKLLAPIMDQIFSEDPDVYASMPKDKAYNALIRQANDRFEAMKGQAFFSELQKEFGISSTVPVPGMHGGALPGAGSPAARPSVSAPRNWSETQNFQRLWKTPSESVQETGTVMDILRERGFGEDIKI